jgi:hypothetical protein
VNKRKAINIILNKICPKDNKIIFKKSKKNKYYNDNLLKEINGKPILLAIGKRPHFFIIYYINNKKVFLHSKKAALLPKYIYI